MKTTISYFYVGLLTSLQKGVLWTIFLTGTWIIVIGFSFLGVFGKTFISTRTAQSQHVEGKNIKISSIKYGIALNLVGSFKVFIIHVISYRKI